MDYMDTNVRKAQKLLLEDLKYELENYAMRGVKTVETMPSKECIDTVRGMKWDLKRITRKCYAIEVLESLEPRYR